MIFERFKIKAQKTILKNFLWNIFMNCSLFILKFISILFILFYVWRYIHVTYIVEIFVAYYTMKSNQAMESALQVERARSRHGLVPPGTRIPEERKNACCLSVLLVWVRQNSPFFSWLWLSFSFSLTSWGLPFSVWVCPESLARSSVDCF